MRAHTQNVHNLQITKYKEIHGQFEILEVPTLKLPHITCFYSVQVVWHSCHICGKLVLMDSDALGGHIKGTHKMKEKDYKEQYCVYKKMPLTLRQSESEVLSTRLLKRKPSEHLEEEIARPQKKLKKAFLTKDTMGSKKSTEGNRRDSKAAGVDKERRLISNKRTEKDSFAEEVVEVRMKGSASRRGSSSISQRRSIGRENRKLSRADVKLTADKESKKDKRNIDSMSKGKVTNKRIATLKNENRLFEESVLANSGTQVLKKSDRRKLPERNPKASSSKYGNYGKKAGLRKTGNKAKEDFDPFVDVVYDCNLKDCQDCSKVFSFLNFTLNLVLMLFAGVSCDQTVTA